MKKYLGIDYGTKKVGIAVSSENSMLAFPRAVIPNDDKLMESVWKLCKEEDIGKIVMGASLDFKGGDNPVMQRINEFAQALRETLEIPVQLEPEFMTSEHARKLSGQHAMIDASAAALILQTFLDKLNSAK